jgi:hypothetical protein
MTKAALSRKLNGHPYQHQLKNWNFWPEAIPKAIGKLVNLSIRRNPGISSGQKCPVL